MRKEFSFTFAFSQTGKKTHQQAQSATKDIPLEKSPCSEENLVPELPTEQCKSCTKWCLEELGARLQMFSLSRNTAKTLDP